MRIVLASASPRRRWLLTAAGVEVDVQPAHVDESRQPEELPIDMAQRLARAKAWAIDDPKGRAVVAADTVVARADIIFGKPADERAAAKTLRQLSGDEHEVITGYCVRYEGEERVGAVRTQVWFRSLSDDEVERYVNSREPLDKAGAYGIQGDGGVFIDRLSGSYTNVIGLPLREVLWELEDLLGPR